MQKYCFALPNFNLQIISENILVMQDPTQKKQNKKTPKKQNRPINKLSVILYDLKTGFACKLQ